MTRARHSIGIFGQTDFSENTSTIEGSKKRKRCERRRSIKWKPQEFYLRSFSLELRIANEIVAAACDSIESSEEALASRLQVIFHFSCAHPKAEKAKPESDSMSFFRESLPESNLMVRVWTTRGSKKATLRFN